MRKLFKAVTFSVLGIVMFFALQNFFIPDTSAKRSNANKMIYGLNEMEEETIDVFFLGSSHIKSGISSMQLYEETRIRTYSLTTDGQPIEASYFLLKDAFSKQHPAVVVLDVSGLFTGDTAERALRWRHVLDNYPLGPLKLEMAKSYAELEAGDGMMSVLFPIIKYHTRWSDIEKSDFGFDSVNGPYYTCGERPLSMVIGNSYATTSEINYIAQLQQEPARKITIENGTQNEETIDKKLYVPVISKRNLSYLLKIKEICESHGSELVLAKIPVLAYTQQYGGAWTERKSAMVKEIANEQGLRFLDMLYDADVGIDWTTDTIDGGRHLNVRGAKKATAVMEEWLLDNFSFLQTGNAQYDECMALYSKVNEVAILQSETDFHTYVQRLIDGKDKWIVLISSDEDFMLAMDDAGYALLEELGLRLTRDAVFRDAYLALIDRGEVRYEAVSGRRLDYNTSVGGVSVSMGSAGWNVGAYCKLSVDGRDYARNGRGLNFVVYDKESGLVIDTVSFDTSLPAMAVNRNSGTTENLLHAYEDRMCFGDEGT